MLENIKACLFDMDGTIIDSMWIWKEVDIEILNKFNISLEKIEQIQADIEGISFTQTATYFKDVLNIPLSVDEIIDMFNEMAFEEYTTKVPYKKGALEFLKYCKKHGIKTAICTSNSRELAEAVGEVLGFLPYMDTVITSCEVPNGKPFPDIYLEAAKQVLVDPAECMVFEDVMAGIYAGKAAGMKVCAIEDAHSMPQKAEKQEIADYYIEDYFEIIGRDE
ncbi:MAG: HAD family phosphatase [Lachnospiraceae bacterium]